ncbi:AAA family ATPase [Bacillus cereus]|nr:AAA family ATPase [Bacillus cereus]
MKNKNVICSSCYDKETNPAFIYEQDSGSLCDWCGSDTNNQKQCSNCGRIQGTEYFEEDTIAFGYITESDSEDAEPKDIDDTEAKQTQERETRVSRFQRYMDAIDAEAEAEAQRITEEQERILKQLSEQNLNFNLEEQIALVKKQSESPSEQEKDEPVQRIIEERQQQQQQVEKNKDQEEILKSISSIVGMQNVKATLAEWLQRQDAMALLRSKSNIEVPNTSKNIVITGNPGVGKTMLAGKLTPVLLEAGFIIKDKFIDVKVDEIIGQYIGDTTKKTKDKIKEAQNGVFFLDEAYRLAGGNFAGSKSNYGLEAIETIMSHMNDPKNNIVFIFAGYEDKMQGFLDANPGLRSLIQDPFRLTDYTLEELTQIGINLLQNKNYDTSKIEGIFSSYIHQNMQQGILAGNGTTVTQYTTQIIDQHLLRIKKNPETKIYELLLPEDVKNAFETDQKEQDGLKELFLEAKQEISELIGMHNVKREVEKLGNFQYIQNQRKKEGLKIEKKSHHMIFLGDAGTGKTTMARLIGKMFRGAGVLTNGHFVEATKDMLTAGSSIPKTVKTIVEKAKGGILFIDEAYTLTNDGKGKEALDALIPLLENYRDDFICVFAGYEKDMQQLFQLNQGLKSRIPNHFHFEDYNADELTQMMLVKMNKEEYLLAEEANQTLQKVIELSVEQKLVNGNGRWVRNLFEQILSSQTERLFQEKLNGKNIERTDYQTFTSEDISEAITTLHSMTTKNS